MTRKTNNAKAVTPTRDANAAKRAVMALELRTSGMSYEQIARECGYSDRSAAHRAVQRELQRVVVKNVEELRGVEAQTLDVLQMECMKLFLDKENKGRLFAADRILAIMERRAKLFGLDVRPDEANGPQVIIEEVPAGYLALAAPALQTEGGQDDC